MRVRRRGAVVVLTLVVGLTAAFTAQAHASPSAVPAATVKVDCVAYDEAGARDVVGVVYALTHVGDMTCIGGSFTSVSGVPKSDVAAVRADRTLDPTWNPSTDGVVYALATSADQSKIFLGGGSTTVNGEARGRLAAVDPVAGAFVSNWTTTPGNNLVRALIADSGDRLYFGGSFLPGSGVTTDWNPSAYRHSGCGPVPSRRCRSAGTSPSSEVSPGGATPASTSDVDGRSES